MDFEESGSQSLLVTMASKKKYMLPSILERKFFAVESKFLSILSIVASYVKSKCRALLGHVDIDELNSENCETYCTL